MEFPKESGMEHEIVPATLSDIETEIVILKAVNEIIDSLVNFEMLSLSGTDPEAMIRFKSMTHQRFFSTVLVDFLSRTDKKGPVKADSYLGALRNIGQNPSLAAVEYAASLREATDQFVAWLEFVASIDVWLPSIAIQGPLQLSRLTLLKMCGNISKHNFLRNIGVAEELRKALEAIHPPATLEDAMLALADFYEKSQNNFFAYHSSTIAEFLNNIRWEIFEYLRPEFQRSYVLEGGDPPKYGYTYPIGVSQELAKQCYWDLMNDVRSGPFVRRFQVPDELKRRY